MAFLQIGHDFENFNVEYILNVLPLLYLLLSSVQAGFDVQ